MTEGRFAARRFSAIFRGVAGVLVVALPLAVPLAVSGCDRDTAIAVDMIGAPQVIPGIPLASCQVTVTVTNGLDEGLSELQLSYGYMADRQNKEQLIALTVYDVAPKGTMRIQDVIVENDCKGINPLGQPIISVCLTKGGVDCRSQTILSQDGVAVAYK
ncbi:MAG: hypothetical protein K9H25_01255 [Rhodospirillum sp.]|nr:hypothetical protein [Rhodospirillum sp.]MCF8499868.1 hypothetical protein [Rhodospirillum sp.]